MTNDIQIDKHLEKAKDRLASAIVRLEEAVEKRFFALENEKVAGNTIISSELVRALQAEVTRLGKQNEALSTELESIRVSYKELREASEYTAGILDAAIDELMACKIARQK